MPETNPAPPPAIDRDNPWPGLATFTEEQSTLFFGRDEEIRDLTRRAERNALTILFGQSGLGKSSLLQAGVFPRLRAAGYWPVYVRLDHSAGAPPLADQIKTLVQTETARAGSWSKPASAKPGESLWEFFHHRDDRLVSASGRTIVPVLVFDQFEELFTLGAGSGGERSRAVAFISELAELVENRPAEQLVARLEESSAEMDAFDFSRTDYRVVITLREDFLPHLESLKTAMPALMENRMRLARMTGAQALEAVVKPGGALVTEDVARAIVEFVAGAKGGSVERLSELDVEPPLLSVICRELNERRRTLGQPQITADLVSGNRREILTNFYERSVADLPEAMRTFVEDHLLTKSGFRDNLALETALEFPGVTRPLLDTLVSRRLLRIEDRLGVQRVELTHDVLAEVIRASRDSHQQRLAVEQARQRERITRRRMWLARTIAAGLLVGLTGVSWVAWRAIRAEHEQARLREREAGLTREAQAQELAARRKAYASDMNGVQQALSVDNLGRAQMLLERQRPQPGQTDLRGWEWRYLWQFCRSDAKSVLYEKKERGAFIASVAVSADGKWLAVGERDSVAVWNLETETKDEISIPAGQDAIRVSFSPRESLLAITAVGADAPSRNSGNRVLLWNARTRQIVRELSLGQPATGVIFSHDGQTVATLSGGPVGRICLWRVADGVKLADHALGEVSLENRYSRFAVTGDMKLAAYSSRLGGRVHVLDMSTGLERWNAVASAEDALALAFSPDGKLLASGEGWVKRDIRLWNASSGEEHGRIEGHQYGVTRLVFWPDGTKLASASGDQTVRVWDVSQRKLLRTFRGHTDQIYCLALLPDNKTLVSGSKDGAVLFWDTTGNRQTDAAFTEWPGIALWRFTDGGEAIVTLDMLGRVIQRSGRNYRDETRLMEIAPQVPNSEPMPLEALLNDRATFARDVPLLAVGSANGRVEVWDWERRKRVWELAVGDREVSVVGFLAKGARLMIESGAPGTLALREWDLSAGRETNSWAMPGSTQTVHAFSPDETEVVALDHSGNAHWRINLVTGRATRLDLNLRTASPGGFSPDGLLFVAPSKSGYARVLEAATFRELTTLTGSVPAYHSAGFSPDGRRLVTGGSGSSSIMLFDAGSYEQVLALSTERAAFFHSAFSPDGNVIGATSGAGEGALILWRAPSWAEIEKAEAAAAKSPP